MARGACIAGGVCVAGEHVWQRVGACMAGQLCMVEGGGGLCLRQERWPLKWTVRILLECILVYPEFFDVLFCCEMYSWQWLLLEPGL